MTMMMRATTVDVAVCWKIVNNLAINKQTNFNSTFKIFENK